MQPVTIQQLTYQSSAVQEKSADFFGKSGYEVRQVPEVAVNVMRKQDFGGTSRNKSIFEGTAYSYRRWTSYSLSIEL